MRPLEILLCCLTFLLVLAWLGGMRPARPWLKVLALVLAVAFTAHVLREGMHWQLALLYAAVLLCFFVELATLPAARSYLRWLCLFMIVCSVLLSYLLPMFRLPAPTGKYAVGTRILYMVDPSRDAMGMHSHNGQRELMVQLWYPAVAHGESRAVYRRRSEASLASSYQSVLRTNSFENAAVHPAGAPYPLLIFNPAWTGQRTQSTFLMQELASHGFVVASIDHTYYSGQVAFPDGRVITSSLAPSIGSFEKTTIDEELALGATYTKIEAEDDIFVLDQMQVLDQQASSVWHLRLDMARVGVLGHSLGGSAAAEAAYLDPRIKAALNMDGWIFGDAMLHGLAKPFMLIFERGADDEPSAAALSAMPEKVKRYWKMNAEILQNMQSGLRQNGGYQVYIDGTSHWNFSDKPLYSPLRSWTDSGPIDPRRAYSIIDRYVIAFFSYALNGTREPLLDGKTGEFPEVQFDSWRHQR